MVRGDGRKKPFTWEAEVGSNPAERETRGYVKDPFVYETEVGSNPNEFDLDGVPGDDELTLEYDGK